MSDDARFYVSIVIGLQGGLTVFINSLVLLSIRQIKVENRT